MGEEKRIDRTDTADRPTGETSQVLIQVPERVQFTVRQQHRIDALAAVLSHGHKYTDNGTARQIDDLLADADKVFAWLEEEEGEVND